jgi:hypothetical protein
MFKKYSVYYKIKYGEVESSETPSQKLQIKQIKRKKYEYNNKRFYAHPHP